MPERIQKPSVPWGPKQGGDGDGPKAPDVSRPDTEDLLKKMRKVDPNQSKPASVLVLRPVNSITLARSASSMNIVIFIM